MDEKSDKNSKGRTKKEVILWWIYLLIGFVASVVIASMGYVFYVANHMVAVHTPLMDAAMEIRIEIATAHLWFEEIISGDRDESIDAVWGHLDKADWYAQAMLEGGEKMLEGGKKSPWKYYPADDASVRSDVENIQAKLAEFRAITQERFDKPADSPAGSEIDRRYDAVFAELMNAAEQVEADVKQMISHHLRNFHIVQTVLIFICVVLTVLVGIIIGRFMHRQIRDELKLRAANQQLDASNQQLRASEQQLRAANQQLLSREQQLNAANQQLDASNQQLDASNQQLDASNQQLRASEEQLRKLIHNMKERIKELNCLYELSRLNEQSDITLEEIFQGLVELIPPGWHYPEITCARVVFEGREFKTANFKQTKWKQSANIKVSGREAGVVEVYYLKECPTLDEGPFLKEERNLIDGISRTMSEAIERKKANEKLKQAAKEWKSTFDSITDLVSINDKNFKFVRVNKAFADAFEIKPEEVTGKTCYELVHSADEPCPTCPHKKALCTNKPQRAEFFEPRLGVYLEVSVSPIFGEDGEMVGSVHITKDITERKSAEEKQVELLEKVDNINKELKDFASIVSHDLKAPLRGIKTLANWILSDCADKLDDEANKQMNLLLERVERMYNLIEGTLQYSRVGRAEGKRVQINLNNFIPEIINMVVPPENITVTIENELPVIECEETHIMQIFQNLLSNAIKYMDKPQGWIKIGCVEQDGFWKFSIADNGPGIEEKHFEKIFKIFQALPISPDFQGTGVGLTVAKKIVELYDGKIWVESKPGEGSTFSFTVPKSGALQEVCTGAAS